METKIMLHTIVQNAIVDGKECPYRRESKTDMYCEIYPHVNGRGPPVKCDYQLAKVTLTERFRAYHICSYEPHEVLDV